MNKFERYYKAIEFLEGLNNLPSYNDYMIDEDCADIYVKRMRYFLERIGNPDGALKFIHIAGTSGKGTVTTMVHEILCIADKNVGSFISPSVSTSLEKIRVRDTYIAPDEFADIVEYLKPFLDTAYIKCPYGRLSYFEIFLSIALIYFQRQKCEWVVLETGLGGRYDATNVIKKPIVTAITNIDYDHTDILGKSLKKIAFDKAGIIKPQSAFFTTEQRAATLKIFKKICEDKNVSMNRLSKQDTYQEYNKQLAVAIATHLKISEQHSIEGIKNARLTCRFETIQNNPIIILDGAHNRSKIKSTIDNLKRIKFRKLHLVVGIANSKDHISILEQIIPKADRIYFTRFQNKNRTCAHPKVLLEKSKKYFKNNVRVSVYLDPEIALTKALSASKSDDLVLVTGSFFLVGELRKRWYPEEYILEKRKSF